MILILSLIIVSQLQLLINVADNAPHPPPHTTASGNCLVAVVTNTPASANRLPAPTSIKHPAPGFATSLPTPASQNPLEAPPRLTAIGNSFVARVNSPATSNATKPVVASLVPPATSNIVVASATRLVVEAIEIFNQWIECQLYSQAVISSADWREQVCDRNDRDFLDGMYQALSCAT